MAALQYLAGFLIGLFANNLAARFFGPIIVLMLFFNFFATLILFIAAWIATAESPAFEEEDERIRFAAPPAEQPEPQEPTYCARTGCSPGRYGSAPVPDTSPAPPPALASER